MSFECNDCVLTQKGRERIQNIKTTVVGAGGLGGFVLNGLARLGALHITVIDGDVFSPSNINRQLYCFDGNMGKSKVLEAKEFLRGIHGLEITAIHERITDRNAAELFSDAEIVFDCTDNVESKLIMERACLAKQIPLVHGGVNGNYGQVAMIYKKPVLEKLFQTKRSCRNAVILPQIISGLQLNLFVKYVNGAECWDSIYYFDAELTEIASFREG